MCTVSFIPQKEGFVFTSNRDEDPGRAATQLMEKQQSLSKVYYMEDPLAKGTWFAFAPHRFACVLNGAFVAHQRKATYRLSRGAMALASFDYPTIAEFTQTFDFQGIEPFTLLLYNCGDFQECVWDEEQLHVKKLSTKASHLWSSCTLYTRERWKSRKENLLNWNKISKNQSEIIQFHKAHMPFAATHLQERLGTCEKLTNIPLQTTSVSSIDASAEGFSFVFESLVNRTRIEKSLN